MKKTIYTLAAMTLVASTAMASKARLSALGALDNALTQNMTDVQSIFVNPADMHYVGDFVTFELGETTTSALNASSAPFNTTPNAEGGFVSTIGESKFGFYLGKMPSDTNGFRAAAALPTADGGFNMTTNTFLSTENPIEVFYGSKAGDLSWGAGLFYSSSDKKTVGQKQSTYGVQMGVKTDDWAAFADVGLSGVAKDQDGAEVKSTSGLLLGGSYNIDNAKAYIQYAMGGARGLDGSGTEVFDSTKTLTTLGFMNSFKNDGNLAFYSVEYVMENDQNKTGAGTKTVTSTLPVTMGAEVLAASWLKLRGSIKQNVFLSSTKVDSGSSDSVDQDTVTAAGAGLLWGRNNLDVVMTMGTSGDLSSANLGTNASYTYTF